MMKKLISVFTIATTFALVCGQENDELVKKQNQLSVYFGLMPEEYGRTPKDVLLNAGAICELENHVFRGEVLPPGVFRDKAVVEAAFPGGAEITAVAIGEDGKEVKELKKPGFYGVVISVSPKAGKIYTFRRLAYKLADGETEPNERTEVGALELLAAKKLGRPRKSTDASLYIYGLQWWWDVDLAMGKAPRHDWFAFYPPDYEKGKAEGKTYPLYIDLHGSGAQRFDMEKMQSDPYMQTFKPLAERGVIVVVPLSKSQWQSPGVLDLLDRLEQELPVDKNRIYLGGHSMGASGTWRVLDGDPTRFAAALLVAGGNAPPPDRAPRFTGLPMWVAYGEEDSPDGQERTASIVNAINTAGGDVTYDILPGLNHMQSRNQFFARKDVWDWLLTKKK